jgi:Iron-sulfur cluster binding domain of dihydroorotate dehydrogenase B
VRSTARLEELILLDGKPAARIVCSARLIPSPGRYLLGTPSRSDAPLAHPLFRVHALADGFLCAPPIPDSWAPGTELLLRGPLGHGFNLPEAARSVALLAFDDMPTRLLALTEGAFKQGASITLLCENPPEDLPLPIEVQPPSALEEICEWADYLAIDLRRESLPELKSRLAHIGSLNGRREQAGSSRLKAQALIRTGMPCGSMAQCGVCAVQTGRRQLLACEDGPVFDLDILVRE